jgi:hypothetical protein
VTDGSGAGLAALPFLPFFTGELLSSFGRDAMSCRWSTCCWLMRNAAYQNTEGASASSYMASSKPRRSSVSSALIATCAIHICTARPADGDK